MMNGNNLRLGVNIDHVATLREARGTIYPDVREAARVCERAGAHGITIHLREDRRHINDADVYALRESITTMMNLEMANNPDVVSVALDVKPDEVCLVPEKREELTTEGGLDAAGQLADLADTIKALSHAGITVSLFIDPDERQIDAAHALAAPCIELHTGTYCEVSGEEQVKELARLISAARLAHDAGITVNAGHGLNINNINGILDMPYLNTLNIGHSIVSRAIFFGLAGAIEEMLALMNKYDGGRHDG